MTEERFGLGESKCLSLFFWKIIELFYSLRVDWGNFERSLLHLKVGWFGLLVKLLLGKKLLAVLLKPINFELFSLLCVIIVFARLLSAFLTLLPFITLNFSSLNFDCIIFRGD